MSVKERIGRRGAQSSALLSTFLDKIRESGFFLTAKGKLVDTFELHAFGVGLLLGFLEPMVPQELRSVYWVLLLTMLALSLGLEWVRPKEMEMFKRVKELGAPSLREQIQKEGQYFIFGLVIGLLSTFVL